MTQLSSTEPSHALKGSGSMSEKLTFVVDKGQRKPEHTGSDFEGA